MGVRGGGGEFLSGIGCCGYGAGEAGDGGAAVGVGHGFDVTVADHGAGPDDGDVIEIVAAGDGLAVYLFGIGGSEDGEGVVAGVDAFEDVGVGGEGADHLTVE